MLKAYKYRIYPNVGQKQLLAHHFSCARWIYNWALAKKRAHHKIANRRHDFIQQYTASLMCENQATSFAVEDLHVKGMIKKQVIADALGQSVCIKSSSASYTCQRRCCGERMNFPSSLGHKKPLLSRVTV